MEKTYTFFGEVAALSENSVTIKGEDGTEFSFYKPNDLFFKHCQFGQRTVIKMKFVDGDYQLSEVSCDQFNNVTVSFSIKDNGYFVSTVTIEKLPKLIALDMNLSADSTASFHAEAVK